MRVKITDAETDLDALNTGERVLNINPLTTLQNYLKLHQLLLSAYSTHTENKYQISFNEYRVLMVVGHQGVTASHAIADLTGLNIMSISRTVAAIERRGYVSISLDPKNKRRKLLRLTRLGNKLYKEMSPTVYSVADYIFSSLKLDEFMAFDRHLQTLIERVSAVDEENQSVFLEKTKPR